MNGDSLKQECKIIKTAKATKDMYGKYQESQPITAKCRIKEEIKLVKDKAAKEVVSKFEYWFLSNVNISLDDLIEYNGQKHPIITIVKKKNTLGEVTRQVVYV